MTVIDPIPETAATAFWRGLARHGDAPAVVTADRTVSYAELAGQVRDLAGRLGTARSLVLLEMGNDVASIVGYLACLEGGHPVILAAPGQAEGIASAYDPDVVLRDGGVVASRRDRAHDLHPDLAVLLSTSGSTGSPKLVRLSHRNLASNAAAIADYLSIRPSDLAACTLPLHYCYGLSVLNSHLESGAAVLLTSESVVDPGFWEAVRDHRVTTFPGVPYTFELLDRVGFGDMELPSLRYLTQAGGRLAPDVVRRYARLGQERGFDLFVMYGATEATARMAYLPPDLAAEVPGAIGRAIPGGELRIDDGELVYRGDNVMLGYAEVPADLARGAEVVELRTGDLARRRGDGLFEITGRKSRFAKVFGLRIDLARVEQVLAESGVVAHCADGGDAVVVAVDTSAAPVETARVHDVVTSGLGLPVTAIRVLALAGVPRLPNGKPDYEGILRAGQEHPPKRRRRGRPDRPLEEVYSEVLRRPVTTRDSFVSLGGDSLSYVEMSLRLEEWLGHLPADWHSRTVGELAATRRQGGRWRTLEMSVALRASAIILVVCAHAELFWLRGGAHLLFAVAGFNFGRFFMTAAPARERAAAIRRTALVTWLPFALVILAAGPFVYGLNWGNALLVQNIRGADVWTMSWRYWFAEAWVLTLLGLSVLMSFRLLDRAERAQPFWFPMGLVGVGLVFRYSGDLGVLGIFRPHVLLFLFALGWAAAKADRPLHRLLVCAVLVVGIQDFFPAHDPHRMWVVVTGFTLLVWVSQVRVPAFLARAAGVVAAATLSIYIVHFHVYAPFEDTFPLAGVVLSLAAGILVERGISEIRKNAAWFHPRRYLDRAQLTHAAAAARGHDQPAHLALGPAGHR